MCTQLNAIASAAGGTVTASISITASETLTTLTTDAITITVTDAASVSEFNALDSNTSTDIILSGGLSDTALSMMSTGGSATSGFTAATSQDTDVNVTLTGTDANVTQLNAIASAAGGTVTASISITASETLTTLTTDAITITVTDAASVSEFNALDSNTSTDIILSGGLSDTALSMMSTGGSATSGFTAATSQDTDVNVTITGTDANVTQLNAIASAAGGTVTASISITASETLTTLTTDAITITVTDAASVSEFNALDSNTSTDIILSGGLSDTALSMMSTGGVATSGFTAATSQDTDVNVTITGTDANVTQLNAIASAAGGTVTASISITASETLTTLTTDAITITVTDAASVSEFNALDSNTSTDIILSGGLSDTALSMMSTGVGCNVWVYCGNVTRHGCECYAYWYGCECYAVKCDCKCGGWYSYSVYLYYGFRDINHADNGCDYDHCNGCCECF